MKEEATKAGRLYGVCSAGECIVTDAETGFVLATIDGTKQEAFIAPGSLVYVSDDAAVVTEVFKLAPCRGVAAMMLLRKAGGLLPKGFTELEYLESSGTQKIDINYQPKEVSGYYTDYENTSSGLYQHVLTSSADGNALLFTPHYNGAVYNFFAVIACAEEVFRWDITDVELLSRKKVKFNYLNAHTCVINNQHKFDIPAAPLKEYQEAKTCLFMLPSSAHQNEGLVGRLFSARITEEKQHVRDLVPVLDADGTPCMYDKISNQSFYNTGRGSFGYRIKGAPTTFALRDPHRVAPSGVYARRIAENELELIADTEEVQGDGWEWFANTAEAYEHFGITQDELLTE